ncbi:MAG: hypothetical protein R6T90_07895 [Dissulfuribacterales bacterium]
MPLLKNGEKVGRIYNEVTEAGEHEVSWSPRGVASGVYFYEIGTDSHRMMKQMVYFR